MHEKKKSWAKAGEHLGGLAALKRLWPDVFSDEVGRATGKAVDRFVVSTHTMALARQMENWLQRGALTAQGFSQACEQLRPEPVALPRRLMRHVKNHVDDARVLPGLLDAARDAEDESAYAKAQDLLRSTLDVERIETYYSLVMMDGDRMGAILSGDTATNTAIPYLHSFHPKVQEGFRKHAQRHDQLKRYGEQARAISPNRHLAISGALNDFSQTVVRHVVEQEHLGRVLYAGGDDVLAMLPVADLLSAMQRLRHAYSGTAPQDDRTDWGMVRSRQGDVRNRLVLNNGFAWLNGRLMRMMSDKATASTGAVVAHHQAPLGAVLQALRVAEKRAKTEGGRDAFAITVIKRSGGALSLSAKWGEPMQLLQDLIRFLRAEGTSRRAVYNSLEWLRDLPEPCPCQTDMLASLLAYQLTRQARGPARELAAGLAQRLAVLCAEQGSKPLDWLGNFMSVAEFLARETRAGEHKLDACAAKEPNPAEVAP